MRIAIYSVASGKILRSGDCPECQIECQIHEGEAYAVDCPYGSTHIIEGEAVTIVPTSPPEPLALVITP